MYNKVNVKRHLELRECLNCGKVRSIYVNKSFTTSRRHLFCNECNSLLTNREKTIIKRQKLEGFHSKEKEQRKLSHKRNYVHEMIMNARERALKKGLEFNLTDEDIIIPEVCPLLNVPFILGEKDNYEYTPTIDRIDNSKGYIKGNVWVITKKANSMKNSATSQELLTFCTNILRYSLTNREKESIELQDKEPVG